MSLKADISHLYLPQEPKAKKVEKEKTTIEMDMVRISRMNFHNRVLPKRVCVVKSVVRLLRDEN